MNSPISSLSRKLGGTVVSRTRPKGGRNNIPTMYTPLLALTCRVPKRSSATGFSCCPWCRIPRALLAPVIFRKRCIPPSLFCSPFYVVHPTPKPPRRGSSRATRTLREKKGGRTGSSSRVSVRCLTGVQKGGWWMLGPLGEERCLNVPTKERLLLQRSCSRAGVILASTWCTSVLYILRWIWHFRGHGLRVFARFWHIALTYGFM